MCQSFGGEKKESANTPVYPINFNCYLFILFFGHCEPEEKKANSTEDREDISHLRFPLQRHRVVILYGRNGWSARGLLMTQQSI